MDYKVRLTTDIMVWEVATPPGPPKGPERQSPEEQMDPTMDADGDQSRELLLCEERLPPSPGVEYATSCSSLLPDDLPALQEVQEEVEPAAPPAAYPVDPGVSHRERPPPDALWLTQLAHIATGPRSPLVEDSPLSSSQMFFSTSSDLHSYARPAPPLPSSALSPPSGRGREGWRSRKSSECGSAVSTRSSLSDDEDVGWSFSWPPTAWHCFLKGTLLRFDHASNDAWRDVEELQCAEEDYNDEELKTYGSEGLQLVEHSEIVLSGQAVLQLTFDPGAFGHARIMARCQLDHPFYVKNKGWSSFHPSLTVVHHGIPCYEMELGGVCLPPGHRDAKHTDESPVFDTFRSYDFTPLDSSAVYVLSSMARRRRASQSSGGAVSPIRDASRDPADACPGYSHRQSPTKSQEAGTAGSLNATPIKCKRPMNAFMVFAKQCRAEYTQMYPGKDNRAISVLLGECWRNMRSEERRVFTLQAKALADEQKRLNPDCWKRKRSNSGN
ncbi:HMG box-containing protein 1-like [Brachionichthys hirsutus]|uniref:HMG box-containing protein 1-like n=1 Tax=Brachionichthys hirsutus TaxID=412623 RepID=UPI003604F236